MRETKFRAWDTKEKRYTDAEIFISNHNKIYRIFWQELEPADGGEIVVELSTGLKDKNGKEIYEGDIVSEEFEYGGEKTKTIWQVRWCDDECAFELHYVSGFEVDDCSLVADDEENYEVIGNIHENPELIEKEK